MTAPFEERLWRNFEVDSSSGCWVWQRSTTAAGYGQIADSLRGDGKRMRYTHREAYERLRGPVPQGLQLDHLCRNRACMNPDHLEPVTFVENIRRARPHIALKTHCPRGHEFTPENTKYCRPGTNSRNCRACSKQQSADRYRRKKEVAE